MHFNVICTAETGINRELHILGGTWHLGLQGGLSRLWVYVLSTKFAVGWGYSVHLNGHARYISGRYNSCVYCFGSPCCTQ